MADCSIAFVPARLGFIHSEERYDIGAVRKENDCKNDAEEKLGSSSCDCDGETIEKITVAFVLMEKMPLS